MLKERIYVCSQDEEDSPTAALQQLSLEDDNEDESPKKRTLESRRALSLLETETKPGAGQEVGVAAPSPSDSEPDKKSRKLKLELQTLGEASFALGKNVVADVGQVGPESDSELLNASDRISEKLGIFCVSIGEL